MDARLSRLSVIVPTLNEAPGIGAALAALASLRSRGHQVIVADGGSSDGDTQPDDTGATGTLGDREHRTGEAKADENEENELPA